MPEFERVRAAPHRSAPRAGGATEFSAKTVSTSTRCAVVAVSPSEQLPWWWDDVRKDPHLCDIEHVRLKFRGKKGKQITTLDLPFFLLHLLYKLISFRRKYDYICTVECDFVGLGIALWQSLFRMHKPRHVILQFIMREKTPRLASKLKYALLTFMFGSVHRVICSSREEADYYRSVFAWDHDKVRFVPILTDPRNLTAGISTSDGDYLLAAGRVFRDYGTAIQSVRGTPFRLIIVGAAGVTGQFDGDEQVQVLEEISLERFTELLRGCAAVVLPLVQTKISTGQTVLLQAMAMGKLVIATRTAGTTDYVEDGVNGLLVEAGNASAMRAAMHAAADKELRDKVGREAQRTIQQRHLPHHYAAGIRRALVR